MTHRSIKNVQAGRGISICGQITEVDQAPMTVSVGTDNRLAHIFHFTMTDDESSIQLTVWDRVSEFGNIKLGEKVMVSNVTVKRVMGFFAEYGQYAVNFGRGSVVARVPADVDTTNWQKVSIRLPTQVSTAPPHFSLPTLTSESGTTSGLKRGRDSMSTFATSSSSACVPTCDRCNAPAEPFCETTGKPHDARCPLCSKVLARALYCCKTGLPHDHSL